MSTTMEAKLKWLDIKYAQSNHISTLYKAPTLLWLPQCKTNLYPKSKVSDQGLFEHTRDFNNALPATYFALLELSLPPFLAPKYHQMSVAKLTENESNEFIVEDRYTINAVWYVIFCNTFGLGYLKELHNKCPEKMNCTKENCWNWIYDVMCMVKSIGKCTLNEAVPQLSDCAQHSQDFLQEPSIIIQLPWNTVLFHQWLVAALIEVLTFEKHTLELRHWPLPLEIEPVATQLLLLVKHLKEKIYLGFLILSHQVIDYPTVDTRHPTWIMDQVVLPSLARLQFINISTGKGFEIVKSIKKLSWEKSVPHSNRIYTPFDVYNVYTKLDVSFGFSCYSQMYWLNYGAVYWSTLTTKNVDIQTIIKEISKTRIEVGETSVIYSGFETLFVGKWEINHPDKKYTKSEEKALNEFMPKFIKEHIFDKGRLPADKYKNIIDYLRREKLSSGVTVGPYGIDFSKQILIAFSCDIHNQLKKHLIEYEKERNILPYVILLSYQSVDREQILRVTNIIAQQLGITPIDINVKKYTAAPMEVSAMLKCMSEVGERDRDWLWSQFPAQWRTPVTVTQPDINMDMGVDKIVKTCEERIGRIVVNAAQMCFDVCQKGGDIFPDWKTVQYIMPCFVSMLSITLENLKILNGKKISSVNYVTFIERLLKHYENAYITWVTEITPRNMIDTKPTKKEDMLAEASNLFLEIKQIMGLSSTYMNSLIQSNFGMEFHLPCFYSTSAAMSLWLYELEPFGQTILEHEFLKTWLLNSYQIIKDLCDICMKCWHELNHQKLLQLDGYKQLFDTDQMVQIIGRSCSKVNLSMFQLLKLKNEVYSAHSTSVLYQLAILEQNDLHEWHLTFLFIIGNPDINNESKSVQEIYESGKTILLKIYTLYKEFRQSIGKVKIDIPEVKYLPEMSEKQKLVLDLYVKGDFKTLESMLPSLFKSTGNKTDCTATKKVDLKSPASTSKVSSNKERKTELKPEKCRNCSKIQKISENYLICEACVKEKYPDVNYYCSVKCKEEWWGKEHMAEHLEFELGMMDLDKF